MVIRPSPVFSQCMYLGAFRMSRVQVSFCRCSLLRSDVSMTASASVLLIVRNTRNAETKATEHMCVFCIIRNKTSIEHGYFCPTGGILDGAHLHVWYCRTLVLGFTAKLNGICG